MSMRPRDVAPPPLSVISSNAQLNIPPQAGSKSSRSHHNLHTIAPTGPIFTSTTMTATTKTTMTGLPMAPYDDPTQNSTLSNLTSLENDSGTDDFGRILIRAARDERLRASARSGQAHMFRRRAGMREQRAGSAPLHVREDDPPNRYRGGGGGGGSVGSLSSEERLSDPPMRVPREWGRKARYDQGWMRRITSPTPEPPPGETGDDTVIPDEDVSPDTALPSIEKSPPRVSSAPIIFGRGPRRRENDSLDRIRELEAAEWEKDETVEFTMGASLLASTPAVVARNTVLDDIRRREIESLRDRAVTTSRLGEMRERSPELRKRAPSRAADQVPDAGRPSSEPAPSSITTPKRSEGSRGGGEHSERRMSGGHDLAAFERSHTRTISSDERGLKAGPAGATERPPHRREDSHDLLRRLARITSLSPSPKSKGRESATPPVETAHVAEGVKSAAGTAEVREQERIKSEEKDVVESTLQPQSRPTKQTQKVLAKDEMKENTKPLKTPRVTGAWVDTPGPQTHRRLGLTAPEEVPSTRRHTQSTRKAQTRHENPSALDTVIKEEGRQEASSGQDIPATTSLASRARALPGSVLATIVGKSRVTTAAKAEPALLDDSEDAAVDYGDSTIDSLADMLDGGDDDNSSLYPHPHPRGPDDGDTLRGIPLPPPSDDEDNGAGEGGPARLSTEAARLRRQEARVLHDMNEHLRATRSSIRDAKRGLRRFESRIARGDGGRHGTGVSRKWSDSASGRGAAQADELAEVVYEHRCEPVTLRSLVWDAAAGTLCYREGDHRGSGRLRMTVFGACCAAFWAWWCVESVLCSYYCQPTLATSMDGYGVDPDAPRAPFVALTLLLRPLAFVWRPLLGLLGALFSAATKDEEPGVRWRPAGSVGVGMDERLAGAAARAAAYTARAFVDRGGGVAGGWGSMMDDEVV